MIVYLHDPRQSNKKNSQRFIKGNQNFTAKRDKYIALG